MEINRNSRGLFAPGKPTDTGIDENGGGEDATHNVLQDLKY